MSWHCLQELVEGYSQGANWDGEPSAPSKKNPTLGKYCSDGNAMDSYILSLYGMTSAPSTANLGEELSMSSAVASLARTSQPQAKEWESEENGQDCGATWRELSVKFDPDTCSWRTAHSLFGEDLDWSSLTLPKWGSLHAGELWERTTQALPTAGNGAGLWLTPTEHDTRPPEKSGVDAYVALEQSGTAVATTYQRLRNQVGAAERTVQNWPTPTRRDYKDTPGMALTATNPDGSERDRTELLPGRVYSTGETNGTLSPDWVELLMGWPMGWTSLEPLTELRVPTVEQWRDGTWELGVPRVGTGIKDRVNRLKAIGNGQVPQAAAMAWRILSEEL